jgi:hypothetical protein
LRFQTRYFFLYGVFNRAFTRSALAPPFLEVSIAGTLAGPHRGTVDGNCESTFKYLLMPFPALLPDDLGRNVTPEYGRKFGH